MLHLLVDLLVPLLPQSTAASVDDVAPLFLVLPQVTVVAFVGVAGATLGASGANSN